ncbi:hypothetical protein [Bradyrhizobium liaoningense]|uniref:hypothetical protein n=1 Tax=Bradyrhizobium liaoningense TaxID=43992 RepID=UPI0004B3DE09|nr:hypothetical protein [Bradyrhizobium liaoningense]
MISEKLVALGPYIFPALCVILAGAAWAACWLIYTGIERRSVWHLVVGIPTALYLMLVFAAAVSIIA